MLTFLSERLNTTPSSSVVAFHIAEPTSFRVIGENLKFHPAPFAFFDFSSFWPRRLALPRAILSAPISENRVSALLTFFIHELNIGEFCRNIKYSEIVCSKGQYMENKEELF